MSSHVPSDAVALIVACAAAGGILVSFALVVVIPVVAWYIVRALRVSAQDNGDGTYSARTNLNYATTWMFDVKATTGDGKTGSLRTKVVVK